MPAVVRVKRRVDEEPLAALLLNSKRRRVEQTYAANDENDGMVGPNIESNKDELSTLMKFAGTIEEQDISATAQLAKLTKEEARELVRQKSRKPVNCTEKSRREVRHNTHEQRYRVVNYMRTTLNSEIDTDDSQSTKEVTIVDIEKQLEVGNENVRRKSLNCSYTNAEESLETNVIETAASSSAASGSASTVNCNANSNASEHTDLSATAYVYDLYLPDNEQVELMGDYDLSVLSFDDIIYEESYNDNEVDEEDDSDDSNQENYYTNDYPDEDDFELNSVSDADLHCDDDDSDGARYLQQAIKNFVLDDDDSNTDNNDDDNNDLYQAANSDNSDGNDNDGDNGDDDDDDPPNEPFVHFVDKDDARFGKVYSTYKNSLKVKTKKYEDHHDDCSDDEDSSDLYKDFIENDSNSNTESDVGSYHSANDSNN